MKRYPNVFQMVNKQLNLINMDKVSDKGFEYPIGKLIRDAFFFKIKTSIKKIEQQKIEETERRK